MLARSLFVFVVFSAFLSGAAFATDNTWSAAYGGSGRDVAADLYLDPQDESLYLVGTFKGTLDLGGSTLVSAGAEDIFLAKFDRHGNHLWSRRFGDGDAQWGEAIAYNWNGGIVIGGQFRGAVDFGGGPLIAPFQSIFVASFDSEGDHSWSHSYGSWGNSRLEDLDSTMMTGHVFIVGAGSFDASGLNFGGGDLTYQGATDAFIVELDAGGDHRFSTSFGDAAAQSFKAISAFVHSYAPTYVITGEFEGTIDFGDGVLTAAQGADVFTAAFFPSAAIRWTRQIGGVGDYTGTCITHDAQGNLFVGGGKDPNGIPEAYVQKFDSDGNPIRFFSAAGNAGTESEITSLAVTELGDVLLAANFSGGIHFFPYGSDQLTVGQGDYQIYLGRWNNELTTPVYEYGFGGDLAQAATKVDYGEHGAVLAGWFEGAIDFGIGTETSAGGEDAFLSRFSGHYPVIVGIEDIENDQGGQVRIQLVRSDFDRPESTDPVTQYEIFRRIEQSGGKSSLKIIPDVPQVSSTTNQSADWDYLGAIPAHGAPRYSMVVPSLADSSKSGGMHWTTFFVRAASSDPYSFYDSDPDSGYSLDNLAPNVPTGLVVAYGSGTANELSWEECPDQDFRFFRIFRGAEADFIVAPDKIIGETVGLSWSDPDGQLTQHYKLSTIDFSGNESEAIKPVSVSGVQGGTMPGRTALWGAVPNPFNPQTTIGFDLARKTKVNLFVYDLSGRLVDVILDGVTMGRGRNEVVWQGRDMVGRAVAAGTYFCRLDADNYSETKRMMLVK